MRSNLVDPIVPCRPRPVVAASTRRDARGVRAPRAVATRTRAVATARARAREVATTPRDVCGKGFEKVLRGRVVTQENSREMCRLDSLVVPGTSPRAGASDEGGTRERR